jgi:putative FmdB family regulatory protein
MPRYYYHCNACDGEFEVRHGMSETQEECLKCSMAGPLVRIPQLIQKQEKRSDNSTAGSRVTDAIERNRTLLKQMKKEGRLDDFD